MKKSYLTTTLLPIGFALLMGGCSSPAAPSPKQPVYSDLPPDLRPRSGAGAAVANIPDTTRPVPEASAPASRTPLPAMSVPTPLLAQAAVPTPAPVTKSPPATTPTIEDHAKAKTLYSFQASELDLKTALATFAKANNLNIVPDNDISGSVTLDVRDLPLEQLMRALLEANDCSWREEGGLIRVRNVETGTFTVDYLRLLRNGQGQSSATLTSASTGGSGSGGTGGTSGGTGGGGSGGGAGQSGSRGSSSVNLTADNLIDFWKEMKEALGFLLTPAGKTSLAINMTAGLIQVTDRPSVLKNIEHFLKSVDTSVHRQVDIEAKLYDVTLNDQFQFGIDWVHVAEAYGGVMGFGVATLPVATGGGTLLESAVGGLNRISGSGTINGSPNTLVFKNFNTEAAINALQAQGSVEVISQPRIRTLNNQTALIKVGTERPFFASTSFNSQSQSGNLQTSSDQITTITVGTILSITPQISENDWISLDISPVLSSLVGEEKSPSGTATAPILDTKQASTIVRVHDGTTIVLGGLIQTDKIDSAKKIPLLGDIPYIGKWLFTGTFKSKEKKELVIFVTPRIVREDEGNAPDHVMTKF